MFSKNNSTMEPPACSCSTMHYTSSISGTELVLWYLLHVYLAALRWTISSWCIWDFVCGSQTQLLYSIKHSTLWLFADDSIIYKAIRNKGHTQKLQEDLTSAAKWEKDWLMSCKVHHNYSSLDVVVVIFCKFLDKWH
jgi:hypothetical protein